MQCCTCSKFSHLKCSLLCSSHSWNCPPYSIWRSHTYQHYLLWTTPACITCSVPSGHPLLMQRRGPIPIFKPLSYLLPTPSCFSVSLRVLQWNAGGLGARSTELLHFISSHSVDLVCIQESDLNSFFFPMTCTLAAASSFSSVKAYPLNFLPPLFLCLSPTLIMWRSTSHKTAPPRSHFLMFMLSLSALLRRLAESTPFLRPSEISFFLGGLQLPSALWNS